jgi:iron complex transport system substrate-binding protein
LSWWRRALFALALLLAVGLIWRVRGAVQSILSQSAPSGTCVDRATGQTTLRHAKGFTVEYRADHKIVRVVQPWAGASKSMAYALVSRGCRPAQVEAGAMVVETPVRRAISLSTVHAPVFLRLGVPEVLVGIAGVRLLNTPELVEQARQGRLAEVGDGTTSMDKRLDMERIRTLSPDLIMASGSGAPALDNNGKLLEAGFKLVLNTEWLEETALGRAEWIKFTAAFLDKEAEAERLFAEVERSYHAQAALIRSVPRRPTVMAGWDFRGTWYVPGGRSFMASIIHDAGGDYLWSNDPSTGTLPLKREAVLERARNAEVWLLYMSSVRSLQEVVKIDDRNALFAPTRTGRVYNNDARLSPGGGNDYWESGAHRPDLVLADLIAVLHPEAAPGHSFTYYRKLPEKVTP